MLKFPAPAHPTPSSLLHLGLPEDRMGSDTGSNPRMKWTSQSPSVSPDDQSPDDPGLSRMRMIYSNILKNLNKLITSTLPKYYKSMIQY